MYNKPTLVKHATLKSVTFSEHGTSSVEEDVARAQSGYVNPQLISADQWINREYISDESAADFLRFTESHIDGSFHTSQEWYDAWGEYVRNYYDYD